MATAFVGLVGAVVALLSAGPALANGFIKPGRNIILPASEAQGIFVRLARSVGDQPFVGATLTDWQTDIVVTCLARAAAGVDGETAVDALVQAVFQRICSATPAQGANAWTLLPAIDWDIEEADQTLGGAALRLRVQHRTAINDLIPAT